MSTGTQVVLGVLIAAVLLTGFFALRRPKRPPDPQQQISRPTPPMPGAPVASAPSREVIAQARELAASGRKIQAIKLVRDHTNWGLKQATDYVEGL